MTPREKVNQRRFVRAADTHWQATVKMAATTTDGKEGHILYGFLDAALREFTPSQRDKARKNALQWLRRRASR